MCPVQERNSEMGPAVTLPPMLTSLALSVRNQGMLPLSGNWSYCPWKLIQISARL